MKRWLSAVSVLLATVTIFWTLLPVRLCSAQQTSPARPVYLRCEYRVNPLGIDVTKPRLSWEIQDSRRGARQTAYQILVASSLEKLARNEGDLWDSGKVLSDETCHIEYAGKPLRSNMVCYWKVRIWDQNGHVSPYSEPAYWTMGLLAPEDFKARWVYVDRPMIHPAKGKLLDFSDCWWVWTNEPGVNAREKAPQGPRFFRGTINLPEGKTIVEAKLLITADDSFELFVNGRPAGRGSGHKNAQIAFLQNHLSAGKNTFAVVVTNASPSPAGLAGKLHVRFDDGQELQTTIDESWRWSAKGVAGWNQPNFDDSTWQSVKKLAPVGQPPWGEIPTEGLDILGALQFRKEFQLAKPVKAAYVHASALGIYRLYVNGKEVANDYFTPGWTDYHKRVYYNTYNVTELVRQGSNAIGAVLAPGWYAGAIGWKSERYHWGNRPKLWIQLELFFEDGSRATVITDGTWRAAFGPYIEAEFLAGETYDARLEQPGWSSPGFDDSNWLSVTEGDAAGAVLQAHPGVLIHETGYLKPKKITEIKPGIFIVDFGQNFAGIVRIQATGPKGTAIRIRHAEMLNPDGTIYTTNLRTARAMDTYVLKGAGRETYQPRFTYHGFRYAEVRGYPGQLQEGNILGVAINSDTPLVGSFRCSHPMVNQLYSNIVWTQRANFMSVPTDCPQRDERMGWTGDAQVFMPAAAYNADVAAFFTKWLVDLEDAQREDGAVYVVAPQVVTDNAGVAAWSDAAVICPFVFYQFYKDRRILEKHYDMMVRWVEYCRRNSKNLLRPAFGYGDWLSVGADTPKDVLATAYFAYSTKLLAEVACILGKHEDAARYAKLFSQIRDAFNRAYVAPDGRIKGNTQTCYVLALAFDLLPKEKRKLAAQYLVEDIEQHDYHLTTGFIGTSMLLPVLTEAGYTDVAYRLLLQDTFPSWGYSIKHGATTIWERWDGWTAEKGFQTPAMNSFAHYSFGAVCRWMFEQMAGISAAEPGFKRIVIRPTPGPGITWVEASYRSIRGKIRTRWQRDDQRFELDVLIPPNTTATVFVPRLFEGPVFESGIPAKKAPLVRLVDETATHFVFAVPAGHYHFELKKRQ